MANREHGVSNQAQTKFRIGSVSKPFTATAILLLHEQGRLSLDEPLSRFIPDYLNGDQITIHHLLTHTSGIPNFTHFPEYRSIVRHDSPPETTLSRFKHKRLDFQPGEKFFYSNSGYVVLARIIELVTGECFGDYLCDAIFKPLGMYNTGCDQYDMILPHRASGYKVWGDYVHADFIDMSIYAGAGNLYSTVEDLYLWDRSFHGGTLLSEISRDLMITPHVSVNRVTSYGYGLNINNENLITSSSRAYKLIGHSGGIDGFMTEYKTIIDEDLTIIAMCNVHPSQPAAILKDLARMVLGEEVPIPQTSSYVEMDTALYHAYIGSYSTDSKKFNPVITLEKTKLYIAYEPWYKYELKPIKTVYHERIMNFRTVGAAGKLKFVHDSGGSVVSGELRLFGKTLNLIPAGTVGGA